MTLHFLFFLLFCKYTFSLTCLGVSSTDPKVCSGHGTCQELSLGVGKCICNEPFSGVGCDIGDFDRSLSQENYNIASDRLLCGGTGGNFLCSSSNSDSNLMKKPNLGALEGKTIRDLCSNKFWGLAIDSELAIYIWGKTANNIYLSSVDPIKLNISKKAKKVACTKSSLFVLFFDNTLYAMGENENNELPNSATSFTQIFTEIQDIVTNEENIFLTKTQLDTNQKKIILKGGRYFNNSNGNWGYPYVEMQRSLFPTQSTPRILPVDRGVLLNFDLTKEQTANMLHNLHLFAGKDHPSTGKFEEYLTKIDFSVSPIPQIRNEDPIDLIGRAEGGCLIISSNNKFFVSGTNCPNYGFQTISEYPLEITEEQINDFKFQNTDVVDLKCAGKICYILTSQMVLAYGQGMPTVMTGFPHSTPITKWTNVSSNLLYLIPSFGTTNFFSFQRPNTTLTIDKTKVNLFPPSFVDSSSYYSGGILNINIQKPEVFGELDPLIYLRQFGTDGNSSCFYLGDTKVTGKEGMWKFTNFKNSGDQKNYDLYSSAKPWSYHKDFCGWKIDNSSSNTTSTKYVNTIMFHEYYFLDFLNGMIRERREDYTMAVELDFNDIVLIDARTNTGKNNADDSLQVIVVTKKFDRDSSLVELFVQIRNDLPLIVQNVTLGDVTRESNFQNLGIQEILEKRKCDGLHCYQIFHIKFNVKQGVCDPSTNMQLLGNIGCTDSVNPNCVPLANGLNATVEILMEDICVKLERSVELEGNLKGYTDWGYEVPSSKFMIDEFGYFKSSINVKGNTNTIKTAVIEEVVYNGFFLYKNFAVTAAGIESGLVIDNLTSIKETGFHFRFIQKYGLLNLGESKSIKISAKIKVDYLGNNRRSSPIIGLPLKSEFGISETFELLAKTLPIGKVSDIGLIIFFSSIGVVVAILSLVVLGLSAIAFGICCFGKVGKRTNIYPTFKV